MESTTLTEEGKITLPKPVLDALGVHPGDRVAFRIREDGTVVLEAETTEIGELRGILKPKIRGVSVEDMSEAVRQAASER